MRNILTGLLSAALMLGVAGTADAKSKKKDEYAWFNSPSAIAARQRDASTFDETQYYERDSRKIPFGSAEWWRQMDREGNFGRRR
jgi:hypothetical protein